MSDRDLLSLGLVGLTILALLFVGGVGWPMMSMGGPMMGGWTGTGGWWWNPVSVLGSLLLVGAGTFLLVTVSKPSRPAESDSALAIARERYARGEIKRKEFEEIKEILS